MDQRLLVVSPVHNEAAHIERVARALASQTHVPAQWIVVEDQSTDETPEILGKLAAELEFMSVIRAAPAESAGPLRDRLARALEARAFNLGLASTQWRTYTHIAKLDGDIELPPRYFELLLREFREDPTLGLAGGVVREHDGRSWGRANPASDYHVRGALKCYSRECLEEIGGIQERLAWDAIDEIYARLRGYRTRTVAELVAFHYRPTGSADGILRGRARHGQAAYIIHFTLPWVLLRSFRVARARPVGVSGLAFLYGYLCAAVLRVPRVEDAAFRRFVRRELRERMPEELAQRLRGRRYGRAIATDG